MRNYTNTPKILQCRYITHITFGGYKFLYARFNTQVNLKKIVDKSIKKQNKNNNAGL